MATSATTITPKSALLPVVAIILGGFGLALAIRVDAYERPDLLSVAAGGVAIGVALAQRSSSTQRAIAGTLVAASALAEVMRHVLDMNAPSGALLVWVLLLSGVILWFRDLPTLADAAVLVVAAMAVALPVAVARYGPSESSSAIQAFTAVTSCIAFSIAAARFRNRTLDLPIGSGISVPQSVMWMPVASLWLFAGTLALVCVISTNHIWTSFSIVVVAHRCLRSRCCPQVGNPKSYPARQARR